MSPMVFRSNRLQSLRNVGNQVFTIFATGAQPNETVSNRVASPSRSSLCRCLQSPKTCRFKNQSAGAQETLGAGAVCQHKTHHWSVKLHLSPGDLVSGISRQSGIAHLDYLGMVC